MFRLLVVDDSSVVQMVYKQSFRTMKDVEISFARNGVEALAAIDGGEIFNLIFLDINMPQMDGLECLAALRAKGVLGSVPVVIVSTEGSRADVARGLEAGAVHYLTKPFQQSDLRLVVSRYLEPGNQPLDGKQR